MIKLKKILKESPDAVYDFDTGDEFKWNSDDAYPFYYYDGDLLLSNKFGYPHYDIEDKNQFFKKHGISRHETYDGRIWLKGEMISFWNYPKTSKEMKDISDKLSDKIGNGVDVWNNFRIEIQRDDGETKNIIPVKNFLKSSNPSAQEFEKHLLSPIAKGNMDINFTGGSRKRPAGLTATQRHQLIRTSESNR